MFDSVYARGELLLESQLAWECRSKWVVNFIYLELGAREGWSPVFDSVYARVSTRADPGINPFLEHQSMGAREG